MFLKIFTEDKELLPATITHVLPPSVPILYCARVSYSPPRPSEYARNRHLQEHLNHRSPQYLSPNNRTASQYAQARTV